MKEQTLTDAGRRAFLKSGIALGRLSVMPALSETELAATEVNDREIL
jgi:hypothetical protein